MDKVLLLILQKKIIYYLCNSTSTRLYLGAITLSIAFIFETAVWTAQLRLFNERQNRFHIYSCRYFIKWNVCVSAINAPKKRRNSKTRREREREKKRTKYCRFACCILIPGDAKHGTKNVMRILRSIKVATCSNSLRTSAKRREARGCGGRVNESERVCKQVSVALFTTVYVYFSRFFFLLQRPPYELVFFALADFALFNIALACIFGHCLQQHHFSSERKSWRKWKREAKPYVRTMKFIISKCFMS